MLSEMRKLTRVEKTLFGILWTIGLALFINAGLAFYFYNYYQKDPIVYSPMPIPAIPQVVKAGDEVYGVTNRCAKDDYDIMVYRQLVNGLIYSLPPIMAHVPKGCNDVNRLLFTIPDELPPAVYHSESLVHVPIHWLYFYRTDIVHIETEEILVQ